MIGNRNSGWLQWTHANTKPLTVMVGGPCLGPPKPGVPGRGGAQGPALAPGGRAALMGRLLTLAEGRSRALRPARGASAHQPRRHHEHQGEEAGRPPAASPAPQSPSAAVPWGTRPP